MAYVAPAKDTIVVVGGLGTQVDKNTANGGGATKTAWDAGSPSDFIEAVAGGTITSSADAAFDYGDKTITAVGIGTGVTEGTLCYLDDGAAEASFFTGRYEVTTVAANVLTFANIELSGVDTDQANGVTCNVGGAIDGLQNALDKPVNSAALYNRYIYTNFAEDVGTQIDHDTNSGSATTRLFVTGYNAALTTEEEVTLTATADIVSLVRFDADVDYSEWKLIDFYAGGKDASKAEYALNNDENSSNYHTLIQCKFRGAEKEGLHINVSSNWNVIGCESSLNGTTGLGGFPIYCVFMGCSFHDNDTHGVAITYVENLFLGCLMYDNGKDDAVGDGLNFNAAADKNTIVGCTSHGNFGDGFHIDDLADFCVILNNTAVKNGDYGFDLQGKTIEPCAFFGYNHAYDNDQNAGIAAGADYCSETATEAAFQTFRNGNNKTGDPKFTNVGDGVEDFTPLADSDLIDNALDAGTA